MKSTEFVTKLWECVPSTESLQARGFSEELVEEFRNAHKAIERSSPIHGNQSDALLELIDNYDLSTVRIGMVFFNSMAENAHDKWIIGEFEADLLVISDNGEIEVEEYGTDGHLLWKCAANSSSFLDALIMASCFLSDYDRDREDNDAAIRHAQRCAGAAGGEPYLDFYLVLLGCE